MNYITIKHLHMTCVGLSGFLFVFRGVWMVRASPLLEQRWVRVLPHLLDTLLLASALGLALLSAQYPFAQNWLTAKLIGLLIYIVLGTIALKRGRTRTMRIAALVAALVVFAYIVAVAVSKNPSVIQF